MKIIKTASGKRKLNISRKEWQSIGKKAGWMKSAQTRWDTEISLQNEDDFKLSIYNAITSAAGTSLAGEKSAEECTREIRLNLQEDFYELASKIVNSDIGKSGVEQEDFEDNLSDSEADAMTLRDVGWGTDEDYGSAEDML